MGNRVFEPRTPIPDTRTPNPDTRIPIPHKNRCPKCSITT